MNNPVLWCMVRKKHQIMGIYVFRVDLRTVTIFYAAIVFTFYNRGGVYLLCGTNWIFTMHSLRRPGFNTRPVCVRFVVAIVALTQGFLWVLWFYPVPVFPPILRSNLHLHQKSTTITWGGGKCPFQYLFYLGKVIFWLLSLEGGNKLGWEWGKCVCVCVCVLSTGSSKYSLSS